MSFTDKVVVVTGAGSGIGAATAVLFAREGAKVALVGRNENKLGDVAQQCAQHGAQTLLIKADIGNEKEVSTIIKKTVDHFGKLDVLVNNAGIGGHANVADPNVLRTFDDIMNTNLRAVVQLTSLAAPHLADTKGNIVNVSSVVALKVLGVDDMSYSVSKASLDHFTRCAALDLGSSGVRVNNVNPGPVRTAIAEKSGIAPSGSGGEFWDQFTNLTALNRVCEPSEIADIIAFLASDRAKCITGIVLVADNGMLLK